MIVLFDADDQLYSVFEMYAEKMSRPGRVAARAEEDEEYEGDDMAEIVMRHRRKISWEEYADEELYAEEEAEQRTDVDWVRWAQQRECSEKSSIEDELRSKLLDAEQKIVQLEKQVEKTRRELAMEWIMSMKPEEYEQRLLSNSANYKLPDFPRAQPGDEDYPDFTKLKRQIAAPDYKHVLMPEEHDLGRSNYACLHRSDLLYMSVEEFRACAYEEPIYAIYDGPWPPISHTGVSDFDVYG